ncbi:MAG: IS256 family transposase [Bdellovibrionaceae bacterium]|nr:IS256 family transposase [Pseudobdellovibrionaceae bacterium]
MKNETPLFDTSKVEEKLKNIKSLSDLTGPNGVIQEIIKGTVERILRAEQEAHLGYEPYRKGEIQTDNSRNGYSKKTLKTSSGEVEIAVPRDRKGTFEPQFVQKYQSFDPDLEKRVMSMYARGMSTRDIGEQLAEFYGVEVSAPLISKITDKVLEGITQWQARALEDVYAVVFMDAIHYKIRQDGKVISKAAYTCMGVDLDGKVDVLGIWIAEAEGAHFWQTVLNDLRARGVRDILIACIDGLKGFAEAIETIFPSTMVQLCIVHQIRASLRYLASKYHREFTRDLKEVYRASTVENAEAALTALEKKWESKSLAAVRSWRQNWSNLSTFFLFPEEIRRMIYTTNAVEALHRQFRKVTKTKGSFPTDDALRKMLYLATLDLKGSFRSKRDWPSILAQLKLVFGDRIPQAIN